MGPAFESFLTIALPVILVAVIGATVFRQPFARVARYFRAWRDRDLERELEDKQARAEAEREIEIRS